MKLLKVALVGAGLLFATAVYAQKPACDNKANCPAQKECVKKEACDKQCDKCDKKCDKNCAKCDKPCAKMGDKKCKKDCPFEGLNLTDKQKEQIKGLRTEKSLNDSLRNKARADYLQNVKSILTPEQYVQFLENSYMKAGEKGNKGFDRKPLGGRDGNFKFKKGPKAGSEAGKTVEPKAEK